MLNKYERMNEERAIAQAKKRVAAYCRVSTDREDQANSFDSQRKFFREYIDRNADWDLYEIFADEGLSGTSTKKRKAFNRMIACAKAGQVDLIITKEISRFARNTLDSISFTRELKALGVGVIFLNDNINTLDPDAELRLTIMSSIAQEESRRTSQRVKWGQKQRMKDGVVFGRDMLGYDISNGQIAVNEQGAEVVRRIFEMYVYEDKGIRLISKELRELGFRTQADCVVWEPATISRIIRNEKYCGDLVQKKYYTPDYLSHDKKRNTGQEEFVIIKDHHEPIVSRELFEAANRKLDETGESFKGKSKHSSTHCFSGKIKCAHCGAHYFARFAVARNGLAYNTWRCSTVISQGKPHVDKAGNHVGCPAETVRDDDMLEIMKHVTSSLVADKDAFVRNMTSVIKSVVSMRDGGTDIDELRRRIQLVEERKARLLEIYMDREIDRDEFTAARAKCDADIDKLNELIGCSYKKDEVILRQNELIADITTTIADVISGAAYSEEFYRDLVDRIIVRDKEHVDVYLKLIPQKWSFMIGKALQAGETSAEAALESDAVVAEVLSRSDSTEELGGSASETVVEGAVGVGEQIQQNGDGRTDG